MRAAKVDANQSEIVEALRKVGCSVTITSAVGHGFTDIVVGRLGITYLIEIKDGNKPKGAQKLTDDQVEWHSMWKGQKAVANSVEAALAIVGVMESENE